MLWIVDASGQILATYDSVPYPAPQDMVKRVESGLSEEGHAVLDVAPLSSAYWHAPHGAPELKPFLVATADKTTVKADENDEVVIGAPEGSTLVVIDPAGKEAALPVGANPVSLSFSEEGPHIVRVVHPSYLESRIELSVTAPMTTKRRRRVPTDGVDRHVVGRRGPLVAAKALALLASEGLPATGATLAAVAQRADALAALEGRPSPGIAALAQAGGRTKEEVAKEILQAADAYWTAAAKHEALKARLATLSEGEVRRTEVESVITEAGRADLLPRL